MAQHWLLAALVFNQRVLFTDWGRHSAILMQVLVVLGKSVMCLHRQLRNLALSFSFLHITSVDTSLFSYVTKKVEQ